MDTKFHVESDTRASVPFIDVSPDHRIAVLSTQLTSGPSVDRYRACLVGKLELTQETEKTPGQEIALADGLQATSNGTYPLKADVSVDQIQTLHVTADGRSFTLQDPGKPFVLPGIDGRVALVRGEQGLSLKIERPSVTNPESR